jgi:carboxypeptidase-like protein
MKSCLFLLSIFISTIVFGQFTITGKVVDSTTKEPLFGASVFAQNTTSGTTTNREGEFSLSLKSGGYELIVSFTGYKSGEIRISNNETNPLQIDMTKEEKAMEEVIIRSSNEVKDGWDKYGKFFLENFIGSTPNALKCTLQNPEAVHFYYYKKSEKLKVLATEPLVIANQALGYNLRYQLDSFMYYYKTQVSSYRGYCFFSEMDSSFAQQRVWSENRKRAYDGSKLQFMRSYYDSTLTEDGFEIALLDSVYDKRFEAIRNPYDTTYYGVYDSTHEVEVYYPRKISVTYKKKPEVEYLKKFKLPLNVGSQISYIDLLDAIEIKENGYFYDQKDWVSQGYWSWKNLADLLPYDYIP